MEEREHQYSVYYSIHPIGDPPTKQLRLYLNFEQPGPVYAEYVHAVFYLPLRFTRHKELKSTDIIKINGVDYYMFKVNDEIDEYVLQDLRALWSNPDETPYSYGFGWTWDLPPDFTKEDIVEDEKIYWDVIACVNPLRLSGGAKLKNY